MPNSSRKVFVPSAVSSFFEVCDTNADGSRITDPLRIGSRGGGFKLKIGTTTQVSEWDSDVVYINGRKRSDAKTTLNVVKLMREKFGFDFVKVEHMVEAPIGAGFGTSGAGALATAIALSDLFGLKLTLLKAADFAHIAEIQSVTGLGTVTGLVYGAGAVGLVTEPGAPSLGRVDALIFDHSNYALVCAYFGAIEKSSVLLNEEKKRKVNEQGRITMKKVLEECTPESLLEHSLSFAKNTGLASERILKLAELAKKLGALGATQNMIGDALHCLVPKNKLQEFLLAFSSKAQDALIFLSELWQGGVKFLEE
ncbi:hypothetical protein B9Q12_03635 [Candidatus Marsarchaeota G2 archaeon ECH_B_SAG-G06]|uniref:Pantoate kinase n=1 Tax=Candidatus Marsarchaeota G2 archaeon ECH_B_SAG-G06 TaxID=1978166 RepID=A0A2R6BYY2_9ARCH|nr:MAG: hypothetical protein B9Q12_03635 [Candidatus Marsarchaeota G2 archaeon ECH_B_SAG-G06]